MVCLSLLPRAHMASDFDLFSSPYIRLSGERKPEGELFLCSNSDPVAISLTLEFIWDSGLIKPKQMQVTDKFFSPEEKPTKKAFIIIVEEALVLLI